MSTTIEQLFARGKDIVGDAFYASRVMASPEDYAAFCLAEAGGNLALAVARIRTRRAMKPDQYDDVRAGAYVQLLALGPPEDEVGARCVVFLRHGDTGDSSASDPDMSPLGVSQVRRSILELQFLFPKGMRTVFASRRKRAQQAARMACERLGGSEPVTLSKFAHDQFELECPAWALALWEVRGPLLVVSHEPEIEVMTATLFKWHFDGRKGLKLEQGEFVMLSSGSGVVRFCP